MRISTKGRYGLRFLMDLAGQNQAKTVTLRDISRRHGISEKYLWQVVTPLKAAGLIKASPGVGGGYTLAKASSVITVEQIIRILEGDLSLAGSDKLSAKNAACEMVELELWRELSSGLANAMKRISLQDLAERRRRVEEQNGYTYSI